MTPALLADLVRAAASEVFDQRGLDLGALPADVGVERPRDRGHGGYATNLALRSAKGAGVAPRDLAGWLATALASRDGIAAAEVAGPGFVNVRLTPGAQGALVGEVLAAGESYGTVDAHVRPSDGRRAGVLTWDDLVAAIGVDAARFAMARVREGDAPDIDLARWTRRDDDNPAFRVRFAHARLAALARHAAELDVTPGTAYGLLDHPRESELIHGIAEFPGAVGSGAELTRHLETFATDSAEFTHHCRVLPMGDEETTELHRARLALGIAARQVLANGLGLLGVSAPERM